MSGQDGGGYASKAGAQHATRYAAGSSRSAHDTDVPSRSPDEIAEHQAHADLGRARAFVADAAQLATAPREAWAAMRADLAARLDAFRDRMRIAEERAATAAAKAARAPITAALDEAAAKLAAATQPRAVRPLPGEIEIEPRIIAKAIAVEEVIDWYATLSQAQRGEVLDRYRNASSNRADTFAVALLNYGAPHQLTARLAPIAKLDRFRLAQWSAQRDAARPTAANDEPEHASEAEGVDRAASSSTAGEQTDATVPGEVPHRTAMEGIFGASLGHVRAVTDDRALAARGIDGAAEGATVRFATATPAPDLVAHELTHVMQQQQAGAPALALRDQSTPSDAAEVEARAVAGQVAAGDLSPVTVRAVPSAAVQLATPDATADARGAWDVRAPAYFGHNLSAILAAVRSQIADTDWPLGHARISWQAPPSDVAHVITHHLIALTGGHTADRMPHFAPFWHPVDLWSVVDSARPLTSGAPGAYKEGAPTAKGPMRGDASAAEAIAIEFVAALRSSFRRMVPRFIAAADDHRPEPVAAGQLVTSAPIDRLWAQVLTAPALVQHAAPTGARGEAPTPTGVDTFRGGPRPVAYEWMGATDPSMWNVLRVTSPSDATVEEVAAQLYQYPGSEAIHSHNAFAITDAAPFFVLPRAWAKELPDAARWASPAHASARAEPIDAVLQSSTVDAATLSQGADEAAHPLARKGKASRVDVERMTAMLWRGDDQLAFIADQLAPWDLAAPIAAERAWLQRRVAELSHEAPDEAARWAPVVEAQQRTIMSATAAIAEVTDLARGAGIAPTSPSAAPVRRTLASYASAIATSHLADLARTRMATASDHRQQLALVGLNAVIADATSATESLRESEGGSYDPASDAGDLTRQRRDVQHGRNQLRARQLDGDGTDPDQLDDLATKASMIAVRARAKELGIKAGALSAMLSRTQDSGTIAAMAAAFDSRFVTLPNQLEQLAYACQALAQNMDNADDETMLSRRPANEHGPEDHAAQARQLRDLRKKALATAQADLAAIPVTYGLSRLNREAMDAIETNQIATLAVNVMILIAASVATSGLAAYAGGAARGFAVARFGLGADIGAPLVQGVTNVVVDSTLTAGVQTAVNGADFSDGLVENILANAGVRVALARFAPAMAGLDAEATAVWESGGSAAKAGVVMAKGAAVGAELITAAGVSYVAQRIMYGQQPPSDSEVAAWFIQGASMAVGRMVATRTTQINARMERAGIRAGTGHDGLMKRVDAQAALAARVTAVGHGDDAMRLLIENRALLDAEADVLRQLDADPTKAAALGMTAQDRAALSRDNDAARADTAAQGMEVLPLRLAGVDELIPGALWQGSSEDIATALYQARAVGLDVQVIEVGNRQKRWRVQFGKGARVIDIEEDAPRATAGKPARRPVAAIAPEARKLLHQKAAAELASMRVSVMPTEHTDRGYLVTPADGRRLAELFPDIEGAETIEYRKGILVRLDGREWYFEFNDQAHTMTDQRATATDAANGLPDANVATVEVIGYSGARTAFGKPIEKGSPEEAVLAKLGEEDPLIIAGHVAISFDGGKTLWGFTPKVTPGLSVDVVIDMLKAGKIFPGQILDDTDNFRTAEKMAHARGWNTDVHRYAVTFTPEERAAIQATVEAEKGSAKRGESPHGYTFPSHRPTDGSPYQPFRGGAATNGQDYSTDCVGNCAVWPGMVGVPIPEQSGRMRSYMPALEAWEGADSPVSGHAKDDER